MSISDPITDMLTYIRDARAVGKAPVAIPSLKLKVVIAKVLKDEGYVDESTVTERGSKSTLAIDLKYYAGHPVIECLEHVSKPGLRVYKDRNEIPQVINGLDVTVISAPQGPMTDRRTCAADVGGEVIYYVV